MIICSFFFLVEVMIIFSSVLHFTMGNIIYDIASALVLVSGIITRIRTSSCYNSFLQVKLNISLTQIFNIDRYFLKNKY